MRTHAHAMRIHSATLEAMSSMGIYIPFANPNGAGAPLGVKWNEAHTPTDALVDDILARERAIIHTRDEKARAKKKALIAQRPVRIRRNRRQVLSGEGDPVPEPSQRDISLKILQELRSIGETLTNMLSYWRNGT